MATSKIKRNMYAVNTITYSGRDIIPVGNFEIIIPVTKSGYTPIGIVGYNFSDRGAGGKLFVTGFSFTNTSVRLYGRCTEQIQLNEYMSVDVLYQAT